MEAECYQWYENELNQQRYYENNPMNIDKEIAQIAEVSTDIMDLLETHNKLDKLRPSIAITALSNVLREVLDLTIKEPRYRQECIKNIYESFTGWYEEEENNG